MEKKGEVLDEKSLRSPGRFTHSQTSFPFPPIISTSSHPVLGRVGGVFFCAVQWCHALLYRLQKKASLPTQHPNPPPVRPFKTPPQTFLNSGTFSDLSRYVGRHPLRHGPVLCRPSSTFNIKYPPVYLLLWWKSNHHLTDKRENIIFLCLTVSYTILSDTFSCVMFTVSEMAAPNVLCISSTWHIWDLWKLWDQLLW